MLRRAEHLLGREVQGVVGRDAEQLRGRPHGFVLGNCESRADRLVPRPLTAPISFRSQRRA